MPKYFDNERKLPFSRVSVANDQFSEQWLQRELAQRAGKLSLCLRFEGFEQDCLGYVFNIEQADESFRISDITSKQLLVLASLREVVAMILHVSGTRYDQNWQTEFQTLRNQIRSV